MKEGIGPLSAHPSLVDFDDKPPAQEIKRFVLIVVDSKADVFMEVRPFVFDHQMDAGEIRYLNGLEIDTLVEIVSNSVVSGQIRPGHSKLDEQKIVLFRTSFDNKLVYPPYEAIARIYLHDELLGILMPGAKPGWSALATKDGPIARRFADQWK